jgi:hypothetical protein
VLAAPWLGHQARTTGRVKGARPAALLDLEMSIDATQLSLEAAKERPMTTAADPM